MILITASCFFVIFFSVDILNGNHVFSEERIISIAKINIGGSILRIWILHDFTNKAHGPKPIPPSITFRTFERDSSGNQLLIVLESWGLISDYNERMKFERKLIDMASLNGWHIELGKTNFKGGTTAAEMRELFSLEGKYQYFVNPDSAGVYQSIISIKKRQGYYIIGAHSFSGKMFQRSLWWKNIGIDTSYFMENILEMDKKAESLLNYSTPFSSVNDEQAFSYVNTPTIPGSKKFAYFLTENSHLPYNELNPQKKIHDSVYYNNSQLSDDANYQLQRIQDLLFYFIKYSDKNVWSKILIVGDHMPPYSRESNRRFYSSLYVPYLILSK